MLTSILIDLNPCVKDEYFKLFWTESGRRDAQKIMEKVVSHTFTSLDTLY
jgi:hypothetical protein